MEHRIFGTLGNVVFGKFGLNPSPLTEEENCWVVMHENNEPDYKIKYSPDSFSKIKELLHHIYIDIAVFNGLLNLCGAPVSMLIPNEIGLLTKEEIDDMNAYVEWWLGLYKNIPWYKSIVLKEFKELGYSIE